MGGRGSLARQLLGWQLFVVVALLCAVGALSVVQAGENFRTTEGRRMLSVAEDVAATPGVRALLADPAAPCCALPARLAPFATSAQSLSGASYVVIARADRTILASPDPRRVGEPLATGGSTAPRGRSWVGELDGATVAHVPVIGDGGEVLGVVAAGRRAAGFWEGVLDSPDDALRLLGAALVIGVAGSLLLARRVKNQTLGLEPHEITALVEYREALLHGIKEGVVALDPHQRITLVNDHARELLDLPPEVVGRAVDDPGLALDGRLRDVLTGRSTGADQLVLGRGRVLTLNRMPLDVHGAVVTLRDRTELMTLQEELDANRHATDTLRAQAHEFSNRLHTIAGLVELGEYDEARGFIDRISGAQGRWRAEVGTRIADPAVAALLIAKASLAAERGIGLRLDPGSALGPVDEVLSTDLVTVLGNLVDNALDALAGRGWVEVSVRLVDGEVRVVVRDSGPGVAPGLAEEVFRHGFTTKAAEQGRRGLGLALTRQTCLRRGGCVRVHNEDGAVFTARLPVAVPA
ncbi:sensor histidine kinase [Saccharothrix algeriensis]|uniref:histidine kinase n=1 Tax=Saccharothrix algeriensis TaxID=173560 RepID=A0A8T8HRY3_9PSEU|nr:sensor histidine kinase [Saccharothrix algeriensis]MBM7812437.1 sensor histidine kinase regulating citrate/malate metabolism [Saccharothrix algeriensis]QTR01187.1 sensor histidine kinase [Saccharothrix algeriensis]